MKKYSGFTLIEVLVSVVVLAMGLLGLAALQATALKNNVSAYNRSQATQLAYDMADRIRANITNAGALGASVYITMPPANASNQTACTAVAGTCTPAQMAQQDLFEWNSNVSNTLLSGGEAISVSGNFYTITVNWDDNRDGCVNPGDLTTGCSTKPDDPNFQMSFQI